MKLQLVWVRTINSNVIRTLHISSVTFDSLILSLNNESFRGFFFADNITNQLNILQNYHNKHFRDNRTSKLFSMAEKTQLHKVQHLLTIKDGIFLMKN